MDKAFLASKLKISEDDLVQENIRPDRQKLEEKQRAESNSENIDMFFQKIMSSTSTIIQLLFCRGPVIIVSGLEENAAKAKELIMQVLGKISNNSVTLKMEVSRALHLRVIGKDGVTIGKVTKETNCEVSFNKNSQRLISQISITGDMSGVEEVRSRIRSLTPLIFSFQLPKTIIESSLIAIYLHVNKLKTKYGIQMNCQKTDYGTTLFVVEGCESNHINVKEGTVVIIEYICKKLSVTQQIQVQMSMNISTEWHDFVMGRNAKHLKLIMNSTDTHIEFANKFAKNLSSLEKSHVTITGSIHNVYLARQRIIGYLPLVLTFDLKTTDFFTSEDLRQKVSAECGIKLERRQFQTSLTVTLEGMERNATKLYETRRNLLNLEESVIAKIPQTYMPSNTATFLKDINPNEEVLNIDRRPNRRGPTKILALRAMKNEINPSHTRVPTDVWSGHGFSKTVPEIIAKKSPTKNNSNDNVGVTSNYLDIISDGLKLENITPQIFTDLARMLISIGLEKYINMFESHGVTMKKFKSLTEEALVRDYGIKAWGARRKIMLLINDLKQRNENAPLERGRTASFPLL